jgi:hypothetical protein
MLAMWMRHAPIRWSVPLIAHQLRERNTADMEPHLPRMQRSHVRACRALDVDPGGSVRSNAGTGIDDLEGMEDSRGVRAD